MKWVACGAVVATLCGLTGAAAIMLPPALAHFVGTILGLSAGYACVLIVEKME